MVNHVGGLGNDTSMDSTILITDTKVDSLIRTFKERITESVQIVSQSRSQK